MVDAGTAIFSPVSEGLYPLMSIFLLSVGLMTAAYFFIYEVTTSKFSRRIVHELVTSTVASFFLGFGSLFLLLWTGVYV